jgi:nicotinate-nucleotide adenylyltransferase
MKSKPIGILGGTFDPIHLGHVHLAKEIYQVLNLQEIRIIPNNQPPHRQLPIASAADRLAMVKLAIADEAGLIADDCEIRRGGKSYMFDTLTSIRNEIGNTPLYLIMATDAFAGFADWHRWQEIPGLTHLIIVNRPDQPVLTVNPQLMALLQQRQITDENLLHAKPSGYILFLDIEELPISATEIREQLFTGKQTKQLLPNAVWNYIQQHHLYRK